MLKRRGPRTEPWGTSWVIDRGDMSVIFPNSGRMIGNVRGEPFEGDTVIPMVERQWMRRLWSRVSKAKDMLRRMSMEPQLLFRPESKSEVMSVSADSVDLWGR